MKTLLLLVMASYIYAASLNDGEKIEVDGVTYEVVCINGLAYLPIITDKGTVELVDLFTSDNTPIKCVSEY